MNLTDRRINDENTHWIAYVVEDNGCDYTLACGHIAYALKSVTQEEAWEEIYSILYHDHNDEKDEGEGLDESSERQLSHVILLQVTKIKRVLDEMRDTHKEKQDAIRNGKAVLDEINKQQNEIAELARLKAKYEGK